MKQKLLKLAAVGLVLACLPLSSASAILYGSGSYGVCSYEGCSITLSSNSTVSLNVTPTGGGSCTFQSDTVGVLTHNSAGYTLSATTTTTNNALTSGSNSIATSDGTIASPAPLSNRWGFRIDNLGGFGPGPTVVTSNASPDSTGFAGMPGSGGTPVILSSTNSYNDAEVYTDVWYGVCANTSVPSGTYTTQITYTGVLN